MKTTKKTTMPKEIIIDLNEFTPAERKMYDIGGYIAVYKYAPEPIRKAETAVHYYQCASKLISDHQISVPASYFSANRNIEFDLVNKTFLTTFARLDYNMLCAVMERFKELGWDIE
ncbi:MAG: hypothetical protein IIT39_08845 [Clostridia bacterium]|nr:hypothetical protein [Clostridia bacterium]